LCKKTDDVNITYSEEPATERNFDLIKRKMMLMQIGMKRNNGHRRLSQQAFDVSGDLPPMSSKSHRPNVFETREERKRRLLEDERSKQMADMKRRMMYHGPTTFHPPVNCLVTAWSPWSECSASCEAEIGQVGRKRQRRASREKFRMIKRHEAGGGRKCPKRLRRRQKCQVPACQGDCTVAEWGEWSACSQSCGQDGMQERLRNVPNEPGIGGRPCGPRTESRMCSLADCPQTSN